MPAIVKTLPKYCLHKPSGRAYLRIRGRVRYCGRHGTPESLEEYGRLVAELAQGTAESDRPAAGTITVVELAAAYLDFAAGYYRKNGQPSRSLYNVKLGIRPAVKLYGREPVATFSPLCLLALQQSLVGDTTRRHVNEQVRIVKRMFKWGVSRALVPPTVFTALATVEGLRKGRTTAREPAPVSPCRPPWSI